MKPHDRESNVFCRLFSYRNRPGRTSEEDFLTEAYAAVLLCGKAAASFVLRDLFGVQISEDFSLKTQMQYCSDRPDMQFRDDKYLVFQENKVGAEFDKGQVQRYQDCLSRHKEGREPLIVTCTVDRVAPIEHPSVRHVPRRWSDVYSFIEKHIDRVEGTSRRLWDDFLFFLESKGMQGFNKLDRDAVEAFPGIVRLRRQLVQLLDLLNPYIETNFDVEPADTKQWSDRWWVGSSSWDSHGLLVQPCFEFSEDDNVYMLLRLSGQKVSEKAFEDVGNGIRAARVALQDIPPGNFLEGEGDRQKDLAEQWIRDVLRPVEACGLIKRRVAQR